MSRKRNRKKKPTEPVKNLGGRPPLYLDPEIRAAVLRGMRLGMAYEKVAALAGIDRGTLENWRAMEAPDGVSAEVAGFFRALKRAEIEGEAARIEQLLDGEGERWQRVAWWLERFKGYSKPTPQPVFDPKPVRVTVVDPADEPDDTD